MVDLKDNLYQDTNKKWFLRSDTSGVGVEIPKKIADTIQDVIKKDKDKFINCHKFVLYLLGKISEKELVTHPPEGEDFIFGKLAMQISAKDFEDIKNAQELKEFANRECKEGKLYIGQILDAETKEMAHSFLVGKEAGTGEYVCFDKQGFKFPFGVYKIEKLFEFENYHNQKWRFVEL